MVLLLAFAIVAGDEFYVFQEDVIIHPISFSIPQSFLVPEVPVKTAHLVNDTRNFQVKKYRFGPLQEAEYHEWLREHRFGVTHRKGGTDCLRHYELLAAGCIPVWEPGFEDLDDASVTTLPRDLLAEGRRLYEAWTPDSAAAAADLAERLLAYTREHLTTVAMARRLLDKLKVPRSKWPDLKVLYLPCEAHDMFPSYLTASVFHGLRELLGDGVLDVPEFTYAYRGPEDDESQLELRDGVWGQGFTLGFQLPPYTGPNRSYARIRERIFARDFDLVIFGRVSPYEPCNYACPFKGHADAVADFIEEVWQAYPPERVVLLAGDDSGLEDWNVRLHLSRLGSRSRGIGTVFLRELHPYVSSDPMDRLRKFDDSLTQPGCFYAEWRAFFAAWPDALRPCALWGVCDQVPALPIIDADPPEDPFHLATFCSIGYLLKTMVLVGQDGGECGSFCLLTCDLSMNLLASNLAAVSSSGLLEEHSITPTAILFALSRGCRKSTMLIEPVPSGAADWVHIFSATLAAGPVRHAVHQGYRVAWTGAEPREEDDWWRIYVETNRVAILPDASCSEPSRLFGAPHVAVLEVPTGDRDPFLACLSDMLLRPPAQIVVSLPLTPWAGDREFASSVMAWLDKAGFTERKLLPGDAMAPLPDNAFDVETALEYRVVGEAELQVFWDAWINRARTFLVMAKAADA